MAKAHTNPVGELLREWRGARGLSQLDLALDADVSSRHVSFIETGRSRPSREMIERLARALDLPLRECNRLLTAAGFAPRYSETSLADTELAPVRSALERMLSHHLPYPAFVVDLHWGVLLANAAHDALLARFLPELDPRAPVNVMELVLAPDLLRPVITNWPVAAHVLGHRIRRQLRVPGPNAGSRTLLRNLIDDPAVQAAMATPLPSPDSEVLLPLAFDLAGQPLAWFSTITTFGTPRDITLEELSIESLFPADEQTRRWVEDRAPV
jgi:transcriptional regulator with XRE-family HTH domain